MASMRSDADIRGAVVRGALGGLMGALMMIPMMFAMVGMDISEEPFPLTATRGVVRRIGLYRALGRGTTNGVAEQIVPPVAPEVPVEERERQRMAA